jgi:hypothetical protein
MLKLNNEKKASKMRKLENEMFNLVGERRVEAMRTYRKILTSTADELVYLRRS